MIDFSGELPLRRSSRLVVLSPAGRVLLFDLEVFGVSDPLRPNATRFWQTPGGGVEAAESYKEAALRELDEETGITDVPIGAWVWSSDRVVQFDDGRRMRFCARFFLVKARSEAVDISRLFGEEADWIKDYRWWSPTEITASNDTFVPGRIGKLVRDLSADRVPRVPIRIDTVTR